MLLDHSAVRLGTASRALAHPPPTALRPRLRAGRAAWAGRYSRALTAFEVVAAAVAGACVLGTHPDAAPTTSLFWASVGLLVAWPVLLHATGAHAERVFGTGSDEYRAVGRAGFLLLALASFASYAADLDLSRALVVGAVPALAAGTLLGRFAARCALRGLRAQGRCTERVVVVGRGTAALELVDRLRREQFAGLEVVAACVTPDDRDRVARVAGVPVGGLDDVLTLAGHLGADTIAVTSASETASQYLRSLSWQLEGTGIELLVAPGLVEVANPRLYIRPIEELPLLSVEQPRFEGWQRVVKGGLDRVAAAPALLLLAPVLLTIAAVVKVTSPGLVLYRQERVGVNGQAFTDAEVPRHGGRRRPRGRRPAGAEHLRRLLFKMRVDPRVTPVGRVLRRLSLDELPQLLNVLGGSMSLVGPRPPLPGEVARYDTSVSRRLLVKPGLTGLRQISGRSDLSWQESVRLDLRYVENWSLAMDMFILAKTARAVLSRSGAY